MAATIGDEERARRVDVWRSVGHNTSEAARLLGVSRSSMQEALRRARANGQISDDELRDENTPSRSQYLEARERKLAAFQKKKRKGDWRKPVLSSLPAEPFRLKIFGDPHLDDDGCNFELFERHWLEMGPSVYGVCLGDFFNNWLKALAHLWKETSTHPSDAWTCLEYLMEERGEYLIGACSGNHDDWSHGPVDPVDLLMKKYGVIYRQGAVRLGLNFGADLDPLFVALRHKWRGQSMYSPAHWGVRAAREGWRDTIMAGGHIHQDEARMHVSPDGFVSHICQVSAFKQFDTFKDVQGFSGPVISPVWDLVIDPRRSNTDPERVKVFWDSEAAENYRQAA